MFDQSNPNLYFAIGAFGTILVLTCWMVIEFLVIVWKTFFGSKDNGDTEDKA